MSVESKACEWCGKKFNKKRPKESIAQWGVRRYCSQACSNRANAEVKRVPIEDRFWRFVKKSKSGCWEWAGATDGRGYGHVNPGRGMSPVKAYRLSWEIHFGPIPKGLSVCHACDNPSCVNPDHLMLGTQKANMVDASNKNRLNPKSLLNLRPGSPKSCGAGPNSTRGLHD